jgi:3-isopropylmalate dehydrogenase
VLSSALLLEHLGLDEAARAVEDAVVTELAERCPGSVLRTAEVGDSIAARVAG